MLAPNPSATCRVCKKSFIRFQTMQTVCGGRCAARVGALARKAERESTRQRKEALKTRRDWLKDAQKAFNAWVRQRDADKPCISCGRHHQGAHDAGHYLSTGARPELRFDENNCHKQCVPCNQHLHGNLVLYRMGLIERIGLEAVERLEGPHPPNKPTADELKALAAHYRARVRAMKEAQ